MTRITSKFFGIFLSVFTVWMLVAAFTSTARAHPHDALAQCQLPSGKWVMCDDTIHDVFTNEHVAKSTAGRPGSFKNPSSPPRRQLRLR